MNGDQRQPDSASGPAPPGCLDSWKEIAVYLRRDVRSVQRWEKTEGLPVHRHMHGKQGTVYAYPEEIDAWKNGRRGLGGRSSGSGAAEPSTQAGLGFVKRWYLASTVVVLLVVSAFVVRERAALGQATQAFPVVNVGHEDLPAIGPPGVRPPGSPNPLQIALLHWYAANTVTTFTVGTHVRNGPAAIAFDGQSMWVSVIDANSVVRLHSPDGALIGKTPLPNSLSVNALAYDGANVWGLAWNGRTAALLEFSGVNGELIGHYPAAGAGYGLAFDGTNLWSTNTYLHSVSIVNTSGKHLMTIPVDGEPNWLSFDGVYMWVSVPPNSLYRFAKNGVFVGRFPVGSNPGGSAFDGQHLWVVNNFDNTISKVSRVGTVLGTFAVCLRPQHVVFDGAHIWVSCYESGNSIYELALDGSVIGQFAAPWPKGFAFDGAHLWIPENCSGWGCPPSGTGGDNFVSKF